MGYGPAQGADGGGVIATVHTDPFGTLPTNPVLNDLWAPSDLPNMVLRHNGAVAQADAWRFIEDYGIGLNYWLETGELEVGVDDVEFSGHQTIPAEDATFGGIIQTVTGSSSKIIKGAVTGIAGVAWNIGAARSRVLWIIPRFNWGTSSGLKEVFVHQDPAGIWNDGYAATLAAGFFGIEIENAGRSTVVSTGDIDAQEDAHFSSGLALLVFANVQRAYHKREGSGWVRDPLVDGADANFTNSFDAVGIADSVWSAFTDMYIERPICFSRA